MSTENKLELMEPNRFKPDQKIIDHLEKWLERAKDGKIFTIAIAAEIRTEDGDRAVDWLLSGELYWPTALVGAIYMLLDDAKNAANERARDM